MSDGIIVIVISLTIINVFICCLFNGANRNSDYDPVAANSKFKCYIETSNKIEGTVPDIACLD
jgi:hypothetical protein